MEAKTSSLSPHVTIFQIESSGPSGRSSAVPVGVLRGTVGDRMAGWEGWRLCSNEWERQIWADLTILEADEDNERENDGPWMMFLTDWRIFKNLLDVKNLLKLQLYNADYNYADYT